MSAGAGWQDYSPAGGDGWQDYAPTKPAPQPKGSKGWSNLASDLGGIATGIPSMVSGINPMALPGRIAEMSSDIAAGDIARQNEGRSLAYRIASPIAQNLTGANVRGMEESANEGDVGGVWGHAAAVPTAMAVGAGATRMPLSRLIKAGGAGAWGAAKETPIVGPMTRGALRGAVESWRGSSPGEPPIDPSLTSPSRTLPGMNSPEVIRPPAQPIPPRSGLMLPGETGSQAGRLVDAIRQPSNMPTAASRAASDAAFQQNYPKGAIPGSMDPIAEKAWQESAFGAKPTADVGAQARAANPEPPRTATSLLDKIRQQAANLPPDEPVTYGPPLRIEGQDVPADIDLMPSLLKSVQAARNRPIQ